MAADPIESADEESAVPRDDDFQPEEEEEEEEMAQIGRRSAESGWDIEESEEEVLPQRRPRG